MRDTDIATTGTQTPRPAFLMVDGRVTEVQLTIVSATGHVVTERPGESLVTLETDDQPVMTGRPETVTLAAAWLEISGSVTVITAEMDDETMLIAVDIGGVYADNLGGYWDMGSLMDAYPRGQDDERLAA